MRIAPSAEIKTVRSDGEWPDSIARSAASNKLAAFSTNRLTNSLSIPIQASSLKMTLPATYHRCLPLAQSPIHRNHLARNEIRSIQEVKHGVCNLFGGSGPFCRGPSDHVGTASFLI